MLKWLCQVTRNEHFIKDEKLREKMQTIGII